MLAAIALGIFAQPAYAAKLVDVRIGSHPEFTRIVIELDEPSGYRIERRTHDDGSGEILVTIEAASVPRSIRSGSSLVEWVTVEKVLGRSMARIQLSDAGLGLREMILTKPSRIVLDVMGTPQKTATFESMRSPKAARPSKKKPAQSAPKPEPAVAKTPVVVPKPPAPMKPVAVQELSSPVQPDPEPEPAPEPALVAETPRPPPDPELEPEIVLEPSAPDVVPEPEIAFESPTPAVLPEPVRVAVDDGDGGSGSGTAIGVSGLLAGAAGVLLMTLTGVAWMIRRRSSPSDDAPTSFYGEDEDGLAGVSIGTDENRTEGIGTEETEGYEVSPEFTSDEPGPFDEPEKEESSMQLGTHESPDLGQSSGAPDVMRLMQEMQQRVANLESRLDQSIEAREQLEQQVAAQSEELRVQRAAIARTQRALRGMARPEEEATAPALKRPGAPA